MAQVEELTYFGLFIQQTLRWQQIESLLHAAVEPEVRSQVEVLVDDMNRQFKAQMRRLAQSNATDVERWQLIRDTESRYKTAYKQLTGMDQGLLEALLAAVPPPDPPVGNSLQPETDSPVQDRSPAPPHRPDTAPTR